MNLGATLMKLAAEAGSAQAAQGFPSQTKNPMAQPMTQPMQTAAPMEPTTGLTSPPAASPYPMQLSSGTFGKSVDSPAAGPASGTAPLNPKNPPSIDVGSFRPNQTAMTR